MTSRNVVLDPHERGDTFEYSTTLEGGWLAEQFTGGLVFTLRKRPASASVVTDTGATDQASVANGDIVASGTSVEVTIPASRTNGWPVGRLYFDLQGTITGSPDDRVLTIASGTVEILPDVTRSQ